VLFMSGYTENAIVHHGILDAGIEYVQKPLVPDALARRVREVLDMPARTLASRP
jgi:DNA-binding response OmpR family regulator